MTDDKPVVTKSHKGKPRRAISKARLYKEAAMQAKVYGFDGTTTLEEVFDKLGDDVIADAVS